MKTERITVYDAIGAATDEGDWVNGEFHAVVRNAKPGQGGKPSKATLHDPDSPNIKCDVAWFGGDLRDYEGATCLFGGKGMKAKNYKGKCELNMGKESMINIVTAAVAGRPPTETNDKTNAAGAQDRPKTAPARSNVDPTVYFHREMKKRALLWTHAYQYMQNVAARIPDEIPPDMFQAGVSSLFISAERAGLNERVPGLRETDEDGVPFAFVAPTAPAEDPAEVERKKKEAEEKAAAAARLAHEEAERRRQAELDEDVPF